MGRINFIEKWADNVAVARMSQTKSLPEVQLINETECLTKLDSTLVKWNAS